MPYLSQLVDSLRVAHTTAYAFAQTADSGVPQHACQDMADDIACLFRVAFEWVKAERPAAPAAAYFWLGADAEAYHGRR